MERSRERERERELESSPSSRKQRERIRPLISRCIIHSLHWWCFMISSSTEGWSHYTPMNSPTNTQPQQPHYTITAHYTPIPSHSMPINTAGLTHYPINNPSGKQLQHAYEVYTKGQVIPLQYEGSSVTLGHKITRLSSRMQRHYFAERKHISKDIMHLLGIKQIKIFLIFSFFRCIIWHWNRAI